jgi:apolipoprotein D and lipocalin family protein
MVQTLRKYTTMLVPLLITGCLGKPPGVEPVQPFDIDRYLGLWYEIARLDHSFERGLDNVTATYSLRPDGAITVVNRGYSKELDRWKESRGVAYPVNSATEGYLKVSFFGPFYASYVIFDLDQENYQYAFVSGPNTSYLWLLARKPSISETLRKSFEDHAAQRGFATENIIWVNHRR